MTICKKCLHGVVCVASDDSTLICNHFKDSSRYIELPCKVGDTVYRIVEMGTGIHYKQVGRYEVGCTKGYKIVPCEEKKKRFIRSVVVTKNNFFDICENFGKTVFLSREDAEKALKERQSHD